MRPVVSSINTSNSCNFLVKKFREFGRPIRRSVKNSLELIDKLKQGEIGEDEMMISFDIETLFPANFIVKFGSKAEICWKLEELKWILLNNSEVSSYLFGHILLFWKVAMQTFQKYPNSEIFIFGLSKDQTFKIWTTFMNPKKKLILVTFTLNTPFFSIRNSLFKFESYNNFIYKSALFLAQSNKNRVRVKNLFERSPIACPKYLLD